MDTPFRHFPPTILVSDQPCMKRKGCGEITGMFATPPLPRNPAVIHPPMPRWMRRSQRCQTPYPVVGTASVYTFLTIPAPCSSGSVCALVPPRAGLRRREAINAYHRPDPYSSHRWNVRRHYFSDLDAMHVGFVQDQQRLRRRVLPPRVRRRSRWGHRVAATERVLPLLPRRQSRRHLPPSPRLPLTRRPMSRRRNPIFKLLAPP